MSSNTLDRPADTVQTASDNQDAVPPFFRSTPKPASRLARLRTLSPRAGVHVSPLVLGAMSIGDKWEKYGMGSMDKAASFKLLDAFYEAGGNFIDTANNYQNQSSEAFIGEWMEERGVRDQMVIATKYTTNFVSGDAAVKHQSSYTGNGTKSLRLSVEQSLKKLRTSYIDILYLHWWDNDTSIEEVMNSLHHLVQQGKVLYLGISDTPAWVISKANTYARLTNRTPFAIYQGPWNVMERHIERDIIPMCREEGMAIAPWNVLAAGKLRTDAEEERRRQTGEKGRLLTNPNWERTEEERKVSGVLEKIAKEVGTEHITAVAIAYLLHKAPYVFPIIGGRKVEHLHGNIEALGLRLTPEHIKAIEDATPFDPGFPYSWMGTDTSPAFGLLNGGYIEKQKYLQPIVPDLD